MDYCALIAKNLKKHRFELHLSQEKFSEILDIHTNYYSALERGERNPTLKVLEKISNNLNISLVDLLK
jgi:transcriptional regulator with XRE-family HTH domain